MSSALEFSQVVTDYISSELEAGRLMGPFLESPFHPIRCSPMGVVPKKATGKFRIINNLSFPTGLSVNDSISKDDFSLTYVTVDRAVERILVLGHGCYLSKVDVQSAFRIVPVRPSQWHLLGLCWDGYMYFDKVLSMGGRSSPYIFDSIAKAAEWICINNYDVEFLIHLLDDFLSIEEKQQNALSIIINVFRNLGIPIADPKVVGPTTCLEFLGITLDTENMEIRLSTGKISDLLEKLTLFQDRKKCTRKEILSVVGSLSFACKAIVPGRSQLSYCTERNGIGITPQNSHFPTG